MSWHEAWWANKANFRSREKLRATMIPGAQAARQRRRTRVSNRQGVESGGPPGETRCVRPSCTRKHIHCALFISNYKCCGARRSVRACLAMSKLVGVHSLKSKVFGGITRNTIWESMGNHSHPPRPERGRSVLKPEPPVHCLDLVRTSLFQSALLSIPTNNNNQKDSHTF